MDKIEIVITRGCDAEGDGGTVVENAGALLGDVVGNGIGVSDAGTTRALALFTSGSSGSGSFLYQDVAGTFAQRNGTNAQKWGVLPGELQGYQRFWKYVSTCDTWIKHNTTGSWK